MDGACRRCVIDNTSVMVAAGAGDDAVCRVSKPRFVCQACGKRGADEWPDFNWNKVPVGAMGYR